MAGNSFELKVEGIDDLRRRLFELPIKLRLRALRNALAAGARVIRDAARRGAPVLKTANAYRTRGLVRRSIVVRTSKQARRDGNIGVFVNVRPAKGRTAYGLSRRGAKSPLDPFYWRWLEFGRGPARRGVRKGAGGMQPFRFLQNAGQRLGDALGEFKRVLGPQIQRLDTNPKDPL